MLIGARKMCRCLEYETKTRNPRDHRDVEQQKDGFEHGVDAHAERREPTGDDLAGEGPTATRTTPAGASSGSLPAMTKLLDSSARTENGRC